MTSNGQDCSAARLFDIYMHGTKVMRHLIFTVKNLAFTGSKLEHKDTSYLSFILFVIM